MMIACSIAVYVSIWMLVVASLITTAHLRWTNRNHLKLSRRVHHLEMDKDFPGHWGRDQQGIEKDRWA